MNLTRAHGSRWKIRLGSLGLGLLIVGLVFGALLAVSKDLRFLYFAGAIPFFGGAVWLGAKSQRDWLCGFLLYIPLAGLFAFFVLRQLPILWPHLLLWAFRDRPRFVFAGSSEENFGHLRSRRLVRYLGLVLHRLHPRSNEARH